MDSGIRAKRNLPTGLALAAALAAVLVQPADAAGKKGVAAQPSCKVSPERILEGFFDCLPTAAAPAVDVPAAAARGADSAPRPPEIETAAEPQRPVLRPAAEPAAAPPPSGVARPARAPLVDPASAWRRQRRDYSYGEPADAPAAPPPADVPLGTLAQPLRTESVPPVVVTPPASAAVSKTWDMRHAVTLAVQSHPGIASAIATLAQQGEALESARAGYRPQLRASAGAGRQANGATGQQVGVSASQMVYDFGKVDSTVERAAAAQRQQRAQALLTINDVARDTALAVIEAHRYQKLEEENQALVKSLQDIVRMTELRASKGATSQADPITARARLEAAQSGLLNAASQRRQQQTRLRTLTGSDAPELLPAPPADELRRWSNAPFPPLEALPGVQSAQADLELAQAQLANAKAQLKPSLTLDAGVNKPLGSQTSTSRALDHSLSLNLNSNLYQGGAQQAQVMLASHAVDSAQGKLSSARLDAQDRRWALAEQVGGLQRRLDLLAARQQKLLRTRQLYREQYLSLGTRSVLDLLNTEQEIFQAIADQINAQHDLMAAQLQTLHASSQLRRVFGLQRIQGLDLDS